MDPNYMHEYDPARHGRCKTIVSGRICGMSEEFEPHVQHIVRETAAKVFMRSDFAHFEVRESEDFDAFHVTFNGLRATEEMRQFVEDAIREKLEGL